MDFFPLPPQLSGLSRTEQVDLCEFNERRYSSAGNIHLAQYWTKCKDVVEKQKQRQSIGDHLEAIDEHLKAIHKLL